MRIYPEFPANRANVPQRRAEQVIHQLLAESGLPGRALYEARVPPESREVDFAVWMPGAGRFAIEVKGGRYVIDSNGGWRLVIRGRRWRKKSPVSQAREAAAGLKQALEDRLHRRVDILPILALPDMAPDGLISQLAAQQQVSVIYGIEAWVERLAVLGAANQGAAPPTEDQIEEEVMEVMPGF